jgi:uridylate kinase
MNHDHQDIEAVLQTYFDGVYEDDPKKDQRAHSNRNIRFRFKAVFFQQDTVIKIRHHTSKPSVFRGRITH